MSKTKKCAFCDREIPIGLLVRHTRRFCSKECYKEFTRNWLKDNKHRYYKFNECPKCGGKKRKSSRVCIGCVFDERQMAAKARFEELTAASSNLTYGTMTWKTLKRKMITRGSSCSICGSRDKLELDHIFSWKYGKTPQERANLFADKDNLQVLCSMCHARKGDDLTSTEIVRRFERLLLTKDPQAMSIVLAEMARRGQREIPCYKPS